MKLFVGLFWAGSTLEAYLTAAEALVYTSDALLRSSKASPPSISPNTARLLFAQRLGLSQYHNLEGADESVLDTLNTYGGRQQQVLRHDEDIRSIERFLLIVDGVAKPEDIFDHSVTPAVTINSQPSTSQNIQLVEDLLEQDQHSRAKEHNLCHFQLPSSSGLRGGLSTSRMESHKCGEWNWRLSHDAEGALERPSLSMYKDAFEAFGSGVDGHTTVLHLSLPKNLSPSDGTLYTTALSDLKNFIHHFHQPNNHISSTIVIMPATSHAAKRSTTSPYGTYIKPLFPRRQEAEEPLSSPSSPFPHQPSAPKILQASTSPLPRGILPVCYKSSEACAATTNNCSGHGTIIRKSVADDDNNCYTCKCTKTVLTDDEGRRLKTIYWGGPACQKKDISVPFFLLAGITILLVGVIAWGMGLLMSVGNEELPSVIGAGVAGPRAQK